MRHLLVTNDYPPKVGGIQNYLWELYRRLPPDQVVVLTRPYPGWRDWDQQQRHTIIRTRQRVLLPEPWLGRQIRRVVAAEGIDLVMYDPAVPVGMLAPRLALPYGVILHGAEVTVPGRLPGSRAVLGEVLRKASLVVTAGEYSTHEAQRAARQELPVVVIPPGVDCDRFKPLSPADWADARARHGLTAEDQVVLTLSRLVPRKGMDKLIDAVARMAPRYPRLVLLVAGRGRDRGRLQRRAAAANAPVRFLDRVADAALPELFAMSDIFAMLCRVRWAGLEQEGFGIVFVEAAASGVPQVAGRSGGAAEAVQHGHTGLVVDDPRDVGQIVSALESILDDPGSGAAMGQAARTRAEADFTYEMLARRLQDALLRTVANL